MPAELDNTGFFLQQRNSEGDRPQIRIYPPSKEVFILNAERERAAFTLKEFAGSKQQHFDGYPKPVERFFFEILDHSDGKVKILSVGKSAAKQIFEQVLRPKPKPRRNWFMRLLEWLKIVKPLPTEYHRDLEIHRFCDGSRPWPQYSVRVVGDTSG